MTSIDPAGLDESCYEDCGAGKACVKNPGFRHAKNWTDVKRALEAGFSVYDNDGDYLTEVLGGGAYMYGAGPSRHRRASNCMLIPTEFDTIKVSKSELDEVLESIKQAFK